MRLIKAETSQGSLGKNIGCEKAPDKIIKELKSIYLNERFKVINFDVDKVDIVESNLEKTNQNIYNKIKEVQGILIGGDHSITYPSFKAINDRFGETALIMFDAHADCVNNFKPPSHEDFLNVLVSDKILKKERVIIVGLRNLHANEFDFLKQNKIRFFTSQQIFGNIENICDTIMESIKDFNSVYLSIDIDVVDPAFAPGTGYLEPGGLSSRELLYLIKRLKLLKNIKMVDLVEVNPDKDINNITSKLGAKIIAELI